MRNASHKVHRVVGDRESNVGNSPQPHPIRVIMTIGRLSWGLMSPMDSDGPVLIGDILDGT